MALIIAHLKDFACVTVMLSRTFPDNSLIFYVFMSHLNLNIQNLKNDNLINPLPLDLHSRPKKLRISRVKSNI